MLGADRVSLAGGTPTEQLAMLGEELLDVIFRFPTTSGCFCMISPR